MINTMEFLNGERDGGPRGLALEKTQTFNGSPRSRIVIEFNYLKITVSVFVSLA